MKPTVAVTGGRDYFDDSAVFWWLDELHGAYPFNRLVHGAAPGADSIAGEWARSRGVPFQAFKADWKKHKMAAGPIRNRQIIDVAKPSLVIAFPGHRGTADMIKACEERGVPSVQVHTLLRARSPAGVAAYICANGFIHREVLSTGGVRPGGPFTRISHLLSRLPPTIWQCELVPQAIFSSDLTENPWASVMARFSLSMSCPSSEPSPASSSATAT